MSISEQMRVWDMLKISASSFVISMEYFGRMAKLLYNNIDELAVCADETKTSLCKAVEDVREFISGFRAPATFIALDELKETCEKQDATEREVGQRAEQVFDRFQCEMGNQWLIIVDHEHSKYLDENVSPFGEEVRDSFPNLVEDIDEAAKCLALSRYTAAIFHLMRIMEASVHLLAKKLKVSVDLRTASWNDITTAIANALNAMPGRDARQKRKKQVYAEAVANLTAVRIAWRNEVMHPKKTYTRKEAVKVFSHVEGFLHSLIPLL